LSEEKRYGVIIVWFFTLRRKDRPTESEVNKVIDSIYDCHLDPDLVLVATESELQDAISKISGEKSKDQGEEVYG
jgi:hypothetical protein